MNYDYRDYEPAPPRDLTGHIGHEKLREFWQAQPRPEPVDEVVEPPVPVAKPRPQRAQRSDDVTTNLAAATERRRVRLREEKQPRAMAAYADWQAGMSWPDIERKYRMTNRNIISYWREADLPYEPRQRIPDIDQIARDAWQDRLNGATLVNVTKKYGVGKNTLRRHWKRLGLTAPARGKQWER